MSNAAIDLEAVRAHGVAVCGTAGGWTSTVELTWALILGPARHLVPEATPLRFSGAVATFGRAERVRTAPAS